MVLASGGGWRNVKTSICNYTLEQTKTHTSTHHAHVQTPAHAHDEPRMHSHTHTHVRTHHQKASILNACAQSCHPHTRACTSSHAPTHTYVCALHTKRARKYGFLMCLALPMNVTRKDSNALKFDDSYISANATQIIIRKATNKERKWQKYF